MKNRIFVACAAIFACMLWASAFAAVKIGLNYAPPLLLAGVRFMFAGLLLVPLCGTPRSFVQSLCSNWSTLLLVGFFQTFLLYALFFPGMTMVSGATGAITIGSSPLFAALTAHVTTASDRFTRRSFAAIMLGILGISLLTLSAKPWRPGGFSELIGIGCLALGCVCSAIGNVLVARRRHTLGPVRLNSAQLFLGGAMLFLLSLGVHGTPHFTPAQPLLWSLLWLAGISSVGFSIWFRLLRTEGVSVSWLNTWKFIIPVFGALLSWMILPGESPRLGQIAGMVCVGVAVVLNYLPHRIVNRGVRPRTTMV
jgi:drug/metabolite transporter (DMT)-like permease